MDPVALVLGLLAALVVVVLTLAIQRLVRRQVKQAAAHTETRAVQAGKPAGAAPTQAERHPTPSVLPPADQAQAAALVSPPAGPMQALITYTKADGSTSVRDLTLYSRNLKDGQTHSFNCRQQGERITKQFLLGGISRVELPGLPSPLVLSNAQDIAAWLERHVPEQSSADRPPKRPAQPAAVTAAPEAPEKPKRTEGIPDFPPLPAVPQKTPAVRAVKWPAPLPELLPDGARGFAVGRVPWSGVNPEVCDLIAAW